MNWEEIVNNSELVYASATEDKSFRTWSLKKSVCIVSFYESYDFEDVDKVICSVLYSHGGYLEVNKIATILGFNVVDNFDATPKRYADEAELNIFKEIIKPVIEWGLIKETSGKEEPNILKLSKLGYIALSTGKKYKFYFGKKDLLENFEIKSKNINDSLFFPYYDALGEFSEITCKTEIDYDKINLTEIFDIEESDLIKRHKLQSKRDPQIYKSEITQYFEIGSCDIDIRLYKKNDEYYPIVFHNDQISVVSTDMLNIPENIKIKEIKIEWGLFLKLIKDPNAILNYETIIPFEDLLELDYLTKDNRLVWEDARLFTFIAERANADQWYSISNYCPVDVLKQYLQKYGDKLDWTTISLRINDDFLIQNATVYPWNFEAISAKEDIDIELIKTLLLIPELKEQEWDWDNIMPQIDFEFIKSNIDKVNFELSELTKSNIENVKSMIIQYPTKRWDWIYISEEYELLYILENILIFGKYLNLKTVIDRAFVSEKHVTLFCLSHNFMTVLSEAKESLPLGLQVNQANYIWSEQLIDLLEKLGYLSWESGKYVLGFECNPYVEWTYNYFNKYHTKVTSSKGFSFVSKTITDPKIVIDYPSFNWDWNEISTNLYLINDKDLILKVADKINLSLLLKYASGDIVVTLFEQADLISFLEKKPDSWKPVTEKSSVEFVRKHIDYNWDWSILTRRFCSIINVEQLGNPRWVDKWDWGYLTRNLDLNVICDKIDLYIDYWDWEYLTEKLDKDFILNNLPEYNNNWDWDILVKNRLDKFDLQFKTHLLKVAICISKLDDKLHHGLWQTITSKFNCEDLENLIWESNEYKCLHLCKWDYAYLYNLPDFNIWQYLDYYSEVVDWKALSESQAARIFFEYDTTLSYKTWVDYILQQLENYNWDFKALSRIDAINTNYFVLNKYRDFLDWDYLSQNSTYFVGVNRDDKKIKSFHKYINFQILSKRNDIGLTEKVISDYINKDWNWSLLSENLSIKFTKDFVVQNKDKPWNWKILSCRKDIRFDNETFLKLSDKEWDWKILSCRDDIEFNNETFLKLSDKEWDWNELSSRPDIDFSEELIIKFYEKPFDWLKVTRNSSFIPNAKTLSLLKGKPLDWEALSQNKNLDFKVLWDYREKLDWEHITKNEKFDISDVELLIKYEEFVDWRFISQSRKFELSIENLTRFKNRLSWHVINKRSDFIISEEMLEPFANVLDWSKVSQSMEIYFTEELIEKYIDYWDWQKLKNNGQIQERLSAYIEKYVSKDNCLTFLIQFRRTPYIYHFTHLFHSIDIIKNRKIYSRNKAEKLGLLKYNAAGSLVERRYTAHDYARFYFRPQTPTQFYNECLGHDKLSGYLKKWYYYGKECTKWKTYYPQARDLGLPKCPIPVFFKFDLKEVLVTMPEKCFYSNGNMQKYNSRIFKVERDPNGLNINYLYSTINDGVEEYKQYSQQEFLVLEEFDFSKLGSLEIICYNESYAQFLKSQLGDDPICEKINANGRDIFHRNNRKLIINETETEVSITSEYRDRAYLSIKGDGLKQVQILNPNNVQKETETEIMAYPEIKFTKTEQPIEVYFVDMEIEKRNWLIYKN